MLWVLVACGEAEKSDTAPAEDTAVGAVDADGDGYDETVDCDDTDPAVNPGAEEIPYNGISDDCRPATPDDDLDGDGFLLADDCDDGDSTVHPGAEEICDGVDNNCDGSIDEGKGQTFYTDDDGDGYGDPDSPVTDCSESDGTVDNDDDCDDDSAEVSPDGTESCADGVDNDCDGLTDCEDGNCLGQCDEVCDDGADNDGNGLTDCDDAICWWTGVCEHPAGVKVSVLGGYMEITHEEVRFGDIGAFSFFGDSGQLVGSDIWGTVKVLPQGALSWSTATAVTTCTWSVTTVEGERDESWGSGTLGDDCSGSRSGFSIASGCRISSDWFLPGAFFPSGWHAKSCEMVWSTWSTFDFPSVGQRWYSGSLLSSSFSSWSSPSYSGSRSDSYSFGRRTWYRAEIVGVSDQLVQQ